MTHPTPPSTRRRRMVVIAGALALGLGLLGASPAGAAPSATSVTLAVSPGTVTVGETITATATLVATADVFAYDVVFEFDETLLEYVEDSATAPTGGFDAVTEGTGTVTLTHTRLGGSPTLAGDIVLSADFEAVSDGETTIEIPSITLVDDLGGTTPLVDAASQGVVLEAVEVPSPSPSPSSSTGAVDTDADGPLAMTGSDTLFVTVLVALIAAAGLAVGFVLVRRRIASTR